jgi:transcription elongation GreA/GreB family factor
VDGAVDDRRGLDVTDLMLERGAGQRWPMTREARDRLVDVIAQLRRDLTALSGQGLEEGVARLPIATATRRLERLERVLDDAEVIEGGTCAAIGRRATLRDERGEIASYAIVLPGEGEPSEHRIDADSPLGAAVLGAGPGQTVDVPAPLGRWTVTIVAVE